LIVATLFLAGECAMGGGKKRHRSKLASWSKVAGDQPQPGDELQGQWTQQEREKMDARFTERMERALRQRSAGSSGEHA
jgi:hypothetical protein